MNNIVDTTEIIKIIKMKPNFIPKKEPVGIVIKLVKPNLYSIKEFIELSINKLINNPNAKPMNEITKL